MQYFSISSTFSSIVPHVSAFCISNKRFSTRTFHGAAPFSISSHLHFRLRSYLLWVSAHSYILEVFPSCSKSHLGFSLLQEVSCTITGLLIFGLYMSSLISIFTTSICGYRNQEPNCSAFSRSIKPTHLMNTKCGRLLLPWYFLW